MPAIDLDVVRKQIDHQITEHPTIKSRRELARAAGIDENTFGNFFKSGRKKTLYADDLYSIAQALGCSMETLVTKVTGDITGGVSMADRVLSRPALNDLVERLSRLSDDELDDISDSIEVALALVKKRSKKRGAAG